MLEWLQENLMVILISCGMVGYAFTFIGKQIKGRDIFDIIGEFFIGLSNIMSTILRRKK